MSLIPDYAQQGNELIRQLEAQAEVTATIWSDTIRVEYYTRYVEEYLKWMDNYIHGEQISGKGLNELLQFVSDKIDEFEETAESPISSDIYAPDYSGNGNYTNDSFQIMASTKSTSSDIEYSISGSHIPLGQSPADMTENRENGTVDYKLDTPGSFSAQHLHEILRRRKDG